MGELNNYERMVNNGTLLAEALSFLKDIQDPKKLEQINQQVVSINSLTEAEKKKSDEVRDFVRIHGSKKDEIASLDAEIVTKKADIASQYDKLAEDKRNFDAEIQSNKIENQKIIDAAVKVNDEATDRHKSADERDDKFRNDNAKYEEKILQFNKDKTDIENQRKELNDLSDSLNSLKNQTQEKLDTLKKYNF